MPQADRFSTRAFGVAVVALLAYVLFRIFEPFFGPIYWASLLAFMLARVNRWMRRVVKGRNGLAAALMTVGVTLGIAVPAAVLMVAFARQALELGGQLSSLAQRYQIGGVEDVLKLPVLGGIMKWLHDHLGFDAVQVQKWLVGGVQQAVQFLLSRSSDVLFGALGIFGSLALTLFILFFFFRDGDALLARGWALIPLDPERKQRLDSRIGGVTRAVVIGTVLTALAQGAMIGLGFWITGLASPVVFGVVSAVASFIPFVGTGLVWVPAAIYLFAQGVAWKWIFFVVWSAVVVGSADNVLRPLLVSGKSQIGTLTVFFGVLGGLAAFGFIGLFLGPVILALVGTLVDFAEEEVERRAAP